MNVRRHRQANRRNGEYGAARVGRNRTARHRRTVRGDRAARHRRTAGGDRAARHRTEKTELPEMEEETEEREETSIKGDASEEQIAAEQKAWTLINKYADPDYFLTDPERNAITDAQFEELRQAALQAVAGCTTQYEKIKAIMAFVADRTYYDYYAYYNNKPSYWSPYEVYEQKRAMCSGYASLMRTLCISIGIPCMDLEGMPMNTMLFMTVKMENGFLQMLHGAAATLIR